jgi:hypothetical protein
MPRPPVLLLAAASSALDLSASSYVGKLAAHSYDGGITAGMSVITCNVNYYN